MVVVVEHLTSSRIDFLDDALLFGLVYGVLPASVLLLDGLTLFGAHAVVKVVVVCPRGKTKQKPN